MGDQTIHSTAEPDVVPSEVMTGAPEPKPNASSDWIGESSDGVPFAALRYLYSFRKPAEPLGSGCSPPPGEAVGIAIQPPSPGHTPGRDQTPP